MITVVYNAIQYNNIIIINLSIHSMFCINAKLVQNYVRLKLLRCATVVYRKYIGYSLHKSESIRLQYRLEAEM